MKSIGIAISAFFLSLSAFAQFPVGSSIQNSIIKREPIVLEANDAGEVITLDPETMGQEYLETLVSFFNFKKSFETVASYITPTLEQAYDVFILVNVDYEGRFNGAQDVPSQHMKVLQRTQAGQRLFVRQNGRVVGIQPGVDGNNGVPAFATTIRGIHGDKVSGRNILDDLMPVSSGAGHKSPDPQHYVDTPTGIYRINHGKSDIKRYGKGMWHSLYFDLIYPSGRSSGLAIHGTSPNQYKYLGRQRSHGCIRVRQDQAYVMYENLINDDFWWTQSLPDMNNTERLKTENGGVKAGTRALIVLFYGYDKAVADI